MDGGTPDGPGGTNESPEGRAARANEPAVRPVRTRRYSADRTRSGSGSAGTRVSDAAPVGKPPRRRPAGIAGIAGIAGTGGPDASGSAIADPPTRRPTMVDVARHAGVSIKTVSRVVNHEPNVQQQLIDRVLASVAELGFRRNHLARTLRSGQSTATIGLIIEEIANPFYATIAGVAADVAAARETLLITASSEEDPQREEQLVRDLCSRRVDGLLIVPAGYDHSFLRPEVEMGIPVVFLDRPAGGLLADTVLLDNRGGARAGVQRLIESGHRRIGILLDSISVYTMRERLGGAQDALAAAGIGYDASLVRDGVRDAPTAAAAVADMLSQPDPPTALFSLNNRITVGVIQELWRRGSDAQVLGFDDFELSHLMPMPLTVIGYDTRALARTAADLLFARIEGDTSWPRTVTLPTQLQDRGLSRPT